MNRPAPNPAVALTPRTVGLVVLLFATLFTVVRLGVHDGDPTAFVSAGDEVTDPALAPELTVKVDTAGYDGQYFHRLARNPVTRDQREFGTVLDRPAYRHQRIGYPLVTWMASGGGQAAAVPWALIGVNVAAMGALGVLAAQMARDAGRPAWWGFIPAAWPGLLVALSYDLSEVLAASLLAAALLTIRRERWVAATALLTAAGLTRETTLVVAAGVVGAALLGVLPVRGWWASFADRSRGVPVLVGAVPLAVAGLYRLALTAWWRGVPETGAEVPSFIGVPFLELGRQIVEWLTQIEPVGLYQLFQVVVLLAVVIALARALKDHDAGLPHERLALVGYLVVMSMLPVWDRSVVFLRWADEAVLLGWALALHVRSFPIRPVLRGVVALSFTTAIVWVTI